MSVAVAPSPLASASADERPDTIEVRALADRLRAGGVTLIDVRTPAEFREGHAVGARNVPLGDLDPAAFETGDEPVYCICKSGNRSQSACASLRRAGRAAIGVDGGTEAWAAAGLPVERAAGAGRRAISLERQVRIAAGALALAGAALAFFVHLYWVALPAFVGAGLVFAGLTDTCGMGLMLAKMPWNRA